METYVTINNRKYTVIRCDFIYPDGTIRLIVAGGKGSQKSAQFDTDGNFELWEKQGTPGKTRYGRVINMRR